MKFSAEISGYCLVSKNVYNNKESIKWILRKKVKGKNQTGWHFISHSDYLKGVKGTLTLDDLVSIPFVEFASGKKRGLIALYYMPMGTDLQIVLKGDKAYFHDNIARRFLDLDKYLTLPPGSPLSMAHISLWRHFFGLGAKK